MNTDINILDLIFCEDDGGYRIYCDICDKFLIDRYYKNHPESETPLNIFHKRQ